MSEPINTIQQKYEETFMLFDHDSDGMLSQSEFKKLIETVGQPLTNEEIEHLLDQYLNEGNNQIDYNSFCKILDNMFNSDNSKEELIKAFQIFDKNKSGYISAVELKGIMSTFTKLLSPDEVVEMIRSAEPDFNGDIDYNEFCSRIFTR